MTERINCVPWDKTRAPERILCVRLQAMGDVVITLPYIQSLKGALSGASIDFLTRSEVDEIPKDVVLFDSVFSIGGGRNRKLQLASALSLLPRLWLRRYDVVIDLQRSRISRIVRSLLRPPSWSEFDRFSPISAGERTRRTIEAVGLGKLAVYPGLPLKDDSLGLEILTSSGWDERSELVVLNPAGCFTSRNWPMRYYAEFARLWLKKFGQTQFLILGLNAVHDRAAFLKRELGSQLINLVNRTTPSEAFAIVRRAVLILSEDSGLMHMAWVSGVPTVALFGSSRADWSAPQGNYSVCLHSGDLECGPCMEAVCRFGDVHCLTRYTPDMVAERAARLLEVSLNQTPLIVGGHTIVAAASGGNMPPGGGAV